MTLRFAIALLAMFAVMPGATVGQSAPDRATIEAATAQCTQTRANIPRGVLGISDPRALEPMVIDLVEATGVEWVRAEFHWSLIEPVLGGGYRWGPYDQMVRAYAERGIQVQAILTYIPQHMPRDWTVIDQAFQRFAAAAVARYAPMGVHLWEVFNEPNLPGYGWLAHQHDARSNLGAYALLLARANRAVRQNDPQGVVLIGGIASDQHRGLPLEQTMEILYGFGTRNCFDVMAYHPYGYQNQFPVARARVDAVLAAGNDRGKPIWFNEYGWTNQAEMDLARNSNQHTNPMLAALSQRGSADALFWFSAADYSRRPRTPTFGLADFHGRPRPSFETFRRAVEIIR
jgi:polysaccharide biosynthesis protein PslG